MKKILFLSDSIDSPSGFGCVVNNIIENLCNGKIENDYEIGHLSWQHTGNKREFWRRHWKKPIMEFPIRQHRFGADALPVVIKRFKPDIVWTLGDFWMVNWLGKPNYQRLLKEMNAKWYYYVPIDSNMIPQNFKNLVDFPDKVICMSKAGGEVLKREKPERDHYVIPHGVNTEIYKPLSENEREEIRKKSNHINKFVIGVVGRNQDRKQHTRLAKAFAIFAKDKDDVVLHFHCDPLDPANMVKDFDGIQHPNLITAIQTYGIDRKVVFTRGVTYSDGISQKEMNKLYNMFHIHSLATSGEGFGIPILEANACGTPNVITDFTSSRELVSGHGELVKVKTYGFGSYGTLRAMIDEEDMAQKFQKMYIDWKEGESKLRKEYSENARKHALEYNWVNKIVPQWKQIFDDSM